MTCEHDTSTQVKVCIWLHPSDGSVPVLVWSWCVRAVPGVTGFGLPNRRKRVFVLASLHGDARDVLLSQVMHEHITLWHVQYLNPKYSSLPVHLPACCSMISK